MEYTKLLSSKLNSPEMVNASHTVDRLCITRILLLNNTSEPWWRRLEQSFSMHMQDGPTPLTWIS